MHATVNTHDMNPPRGPIIDIDRDELERRLRNRLVQLKEVLFVDDEEVHSMARDLAEAVMG